MKPVHVHVDQSFCASFTQNEIKTTLQWAFVWKSQCIKPSLSVLNQEVKSLCRFCLVWKTKGELLKNCSLKNDTKLNFVHECNINIALFLACLPLYCQGFLSWPTVCKCIVVMIIFTIHLHTVGQNKGNVHSILMSSQTPTLHLIIIIIIRLVMRTYPPCWVFKAH